MSGEAETPDPFRQGDDEVLADVVLVVLEHEAQRLCDALLVAEQVVAAVDPQLLAALDVSAAAYGEARRTWYADMICGDLPPNDAALERAAELGTSARNRMYGIILEAGNPPDWGGGRRSEHTALFEAASAIHLWRNRLEDDAGDDMADYIASTLGVPTGPRYALGY